MQKLHTKAVVQKKNGRMVAVASEEVADREGDIISLNGWQLDNFKSNPVLLWYHNIRERSLPIGKAENIRKSTVNGKQKLIFEPVFETITEFGRTVKEMFDQGFLNSFSVGFIPLDRDGVNITKQELLEISAVPVPALPSAQIISRSADLGMDENIVKAVLGDKQALKSLDEELGQKELGTQSKSAVPFASYELAPEARSWDATASEKRIAQEAGDDWAKYRKAFAWYDQNDIEKKSAYKLPHHDVQAGEMITVWRGVATAMASLLGARGGVDIPEEDRKAVYNHLAKHYKEFDKPVPDYRLVELQALKGLDSEIEAIMEDYNTERTLKTLSQIRTEVKQQRKEKKEAVKKQVTQKDLHDLLAKVTSLLEHPQKGGENNG